MSKVKSHRGLAKRVKQTGSGKPERSHVYASRHFHGKTQKQRRHLRKPGTVYSTDYKRIKETLVE